MELFIITHSDPLNCIPCKIVIQTSCPLRMLMLSWETLTAKNLFNKGDECNTNNLPFFTRVTNLSNNFYKGNKCNSNNLPLKG